MPLITHRKPRLDLLKYFWSEVCAEVGRFVIVLIIIFLMQKIANQPTLVNKSLLVTSKSSESFFLTQRKFKSLCSCQFHFMALCLCSFYTHPSVSRQKYIP